MQQHLGAGDPAFHEAYWRYRHDYDRGILSSSAYWQAVARDLSCNLDRALLALLVHDDTSLWTQPNQPMIDWASALQRAGIPTGILSNIGDAMEQGVRDRCPWIAGFQHHTFSHRLGMAKPEAAIYRHAAQGLGVSPQHILFLDDREENIAAARSIGMETIHYTTFPAFEIAMHSMGLDPLLHPSAP